MGGKSRKSGEVSKRLIERLKKKGPAGTSCSPKKAKPKDLDSLFTMDEKYEK